VSEREQERGTRAQRPSCCAGARAQPRPCGVREQVYDLMDTDLHQIIRSSQPLTDDHFQYFVYQARPPARRPSGRAPAMQRMPAACQRGGGVRTHGGARS